MNPQNEKTAGMNPQSEKTAGMNPQNEEYSSNFVSAPGLVFLLLLIILSSALGAPAPAVFLTFLFLLTAAALFWGRNSLKALTLSLQGESVRTFPGKKLTFSVTVKNNKWLPLFWLTLTPPEADADIFIAEERPQTDGETSRTRQQAVGAAPAAKKSPTPARFYRILPWQEVRWHQEWTAGRRGIYLLNEITASSGDGFGLSVMKKTFRPEPALLFVVYPKLLALKENILSLNSADLEQGPQGYQEDLTLLKSSRDYLPGDSMKRVNWRVLAQQGKMRVNLYEEILPRSLMLILDLQSFGRFELSTDSSGRETVYVREYLEKETETMISLAASIIVRAAEKKARCALALPRTEQSAGGVYRFSDPEEAVPGLLTALAGIRYHGEPAVLPERETIDAAGTAGEILILTRSPEHVSLGDLLERLPEQRIVLLAADAGGRHPVYRVMERRSVLA